jgi:hypothetical protein
VADSLVLGNSVELLGGGAVSQNPLCAGSMFRLQKGFDFGEADPVTDYVASLILDGSRPFGRRADNRTITLPVLVSAPNRRVLAAAREVLEQVIDQDFWTMTWTRDPGTGGTPLPLILDCFRAGATKPVYDTSMEKQLCMMQLTLTIPALPFGRADTQTQISFASPVPASPPAPPAAVVLDNYATIASTQCSQSTQCVVGPYTAVWDPDDPVRVGDPGGQQTPFVYGPAVLSAPVSIAGLPALQIQLGFGSRYYQNLDYRGRHHGVRVSVTLTDSSGNSLSFARSNLRLPVTATAQVPVFSKVTIPVPQGQSGFNYASVVSYQLTITNKLQPVPRLGWVTCYLDQLLAVPPSTQSAPVTRGFLYTLSGLQGTARAPVSLTFQQPPAPGTATALTTAGAGTYTVPANTSYLQVEVVGGGGAGATMTVSGNGGGGGGGEYAREGVFPAAAAQVIPYSVGAGGTTGATPQNAQPSVFGPGPSGSLQVIGNGGISAAQNSATGGTGGSGSGNSVEYPGGAGRTNPAGTVGGGGGSSGGSASAGQVPQGTGSVLFTSTGTTNWTCPNGVTQIYVECWGGGGGAGAGSTNYNGAGGGGSEYRAGYIPVTAGHVYSVIVGTGGSGGSGSGSGGQAGSPGVQSSFTGDSGSQIIAQPGQGGLGGTWNGGGGNGGTGGTGTAGYAGGMGGNASPYTGGGGSSAGPGSAGNTGGDPYGAAAPSGGGAGGNGSGGHTGVGSAGVQPGGGGGGSYYNGYAGGAGAAGQVRITYPAGIGAPTNVGGTAVTGGGAGGAGSGTAGTAGTAGTSPGGGGGGADSSGTTVAGGAGAAGKITVTPYTPAAFKSLIVHRPPLGAPKTFQPLVSVGGGNDTPNGGTQYTMPQPLTGVSAAFNGTYTVYLIAKSWSGSSARNVFVTVTQYEYSGGASYSVSTTPVTITPAQVVNGIVTAGVLTLPIKQVAADNTGGYYTVSVTSGQTGDRFYDCLFLDCQGSTVVINEPTTGYISYFIDEPDPVADIGPVLGSQSGRPNAVSVTDVATISGPALSIDPADGDNQIFVYSADGAAPAIAVSYASRYFFDRFQ